ncbi:MAG TPA: epimerase, partial [Chromatiaceae bacterium]|nr:epimerase [Chromatiaceae bacterium]
MIRRRVILITGASGEVGHGLIHRLAESGDHLPIVVLDIKKL